MKLKPDRVIVDAYRKTKAQLHGRMRAGAEIDELVARKEFLERLYDLDS